MGRCENGHEARPEDSYCSACGARVTESDGPTLEGDEPLDGEVSRGGRVGRSSPRPPERDRRYFPRWLKIAAALLGITLLLLLAWGFTVRRNSSSSAPSSSPPSSSAIDFNNPASIYDCELLHRAPISATYNLNLVGPATFTSLGGVPGCALYLQGAPSESIDIFVASSTFTTASFELLARNKLIQSTSTSPIPGPWTVGYLGQFPRTPAVMGLVLEGSTAVEVDCEGPDLANYSLLSFVLHSAVG